MAQYGEWGGPIKKGLGNQTQACLNGSNVNVTITHPDTASPESNKSVMCLVTTSGNAYVNPNGAAATTELPLTSSDSLICKITEGGTLGVWGNGGTPTITIRKFVA